MVNVDEAEKKLAAARYLWTMLSVVTPKTQTIGGGGVDITMNDAASAAECCVSCRRHSACGYFTYDPNQRLCYLKKGTGNVVSALGLISGKAAGAL